MDWKETTRSFVKTAGWKPLICMQGGGARGAWQAGVLEGLLENQDLKAPVAMWGTSAGAINALWAATAHQNAPRGHLLECWIKFARRIVGVGIVSILCILSCATLLLWAAFKQGPVLIFTVALVLAALAFTAKKRLFGIERLPGIIPVRYASKILPFNNCSARWYTYFCAADVSLPASPTSWSWETLACFVMAPKSDRASLILPVKRLDIDPRLAAMCSAALPILIQPFSVEDHRLLDGGLEANLPAGHILSQGMSGGNCAICIVPRLLSELDPSDHVDYRTVKFLREMESAQSTSRANIQGATSSTHAAHTLRPILLIHPDEELKSGLLKGFIFPSLLRKEFEQGYRQGQELKGALGTFQSGEDGALSGYLLENSNLPSLSSVPPKTPFWRYWVNSGWR